MALPLIASVLVHVERERSDPRMCVREYFRRRCHRRSCQPNKISRSVDQIWLYRPASITFSGSLNEYDITSEENGVSFERYLADDHSSLMEKRRAFLRFRVLT